MIKLQCRNLEEGSINHLVQWDKNQLVKIDLPVQHQNIEIHYAHSISPDISYVDDKVVSSDSRGITLQIPDAFLQDAGKLFIFIYTHDGSNENPYTTSYVAELFIKEKPMPAGYVNDMKLPVVNTSELKQELEYIKSEIDNIEPRVSDAVNTIEQTKTNSLQSIANETNTQLTNIQTQGNLAVTTASDLNDQIIQAGSNAVDSVTRTKNQSLESVNNEGAAQLDILQTECGLSIEEITKATNDGIQKIQTQTTNLASAFVEQTSDLVVIAKDVSPIQHTLDISVERDNLIPYPYSDSTTTSSGVTWTDKGDGTIEIIGTPTERSSIDLSYDLRVDKHDIYVFSGYNTAQNVTGQLILRHADGQSIGVIPGDQSGDNIVLDCNKFHDIFSIGIRLVTIDNGKPCSGVVQPKLQTGAVATPWTPYVDDITLSKVNIYGENLVDFTQAVPYHPADQITINRLDNSVTWTGTDYFRIPVQLKKGMKIKLLYETEFDNYHSTAILRGEDNVAQIIGVGTAEKVYSDKNVVEIMKKVSHIKDTHKYWNIRIVIDGENTDYKPYQMKSYSVDLGGSVSDVRSTAPTMTIMSDTDGIRINAAYHLDGKKYIDRKFAELQHAIISQGGNI